MAVKLYLKLDGKYLSVRGWDERHAATDFLAKEPHRSLADALAAYPGARIVRVRMRSRDDVWNEAIEKAASLVEKALARSGLSLVFINEIRALKR